MRTREALVITLTILCTAGLAHADYKIVQQHAQDGLSMMGQNHPPTDEEHVFWIGDKKMRIDQGESSTIVEMNAKKMYILDHEGRTYTAVDLPVDLSSLLPMEMADQMMAMMKFDVTVTPTDETKKVGEWNAKRYNLTMTSAMIVVNSVLWASTETPINAADYIDLYSEVMSLQPGMQEMIEKLRGIDGYVVSQEATMSMKFAEGTEVKSRDFVKSIEEADAPAGTYDPPTDYTLEEFDYMAMLQDR
jgi:hypothetical protein